MTNTMMTNGAAVEEHSISIEDAVVENAVNPRNRAKIKVSQGIRGVGPVLVAPGGARKSSNQAIDVGGLELDDQLAARTDNIIEFNCGTSIATTVAPAQAVLDRAFGARFVRMTLDTDEASALAMRDGATTVTIRIADIVKRSEHRLARDPEFAQLYQQLDIGDLRYEDDLSGHGSSDRRRTALAYLLAEQEIERLLVKLVHPFASTSRHGRTNGIAKRIEALAAKQKTDRRTVIFVFRYTYAGRSGNPLALLTAAHLRKLCDQYGVDAAFIQHTLGPVAFAGAIETLDGRQPVFEHAVSAFLEQQAIRTGAASCFDVNAAQLFDFAFHSDIPWRTSRSGELIALDDAEREQWLKQQGGVASILTQLLAKGHLLSDMYSAASAQDEDRISGTSLVTARLSAIDRVYLDETLSLVAARDALRMLVDWHDIADDAPSRSETEGREFAENLSTFETSAFKSRAVIQASGTEIAPEVRPFPGSRAVDYSERAPSPESWRNQALMLLQRAAVAVNELDGEATVKGLLGARIESLIEADRQRVLRARQARQIDGLSTENWLAGVRSVRREQIGALERQTAEVERALKQAERAVGHSRGHLTSQWSRLWNGQPSLLAEAKEAYREYATAWFAKTLHDELRAALRADLNWYAELDEYVVLASRKAKHGLNGLAQRLGSHPSSAIDRLGIGLLENNLDLAEAIVGQVPVLDPEGMASLPDDPDVIITWARTQMAPAVEDWTSQLSTVQGALELKTNHLARLKGLELDDDQCSGTVWETIVEQLIDPIVDTVTELAPPNGQIRNYLLGNQADLPSFEEGDVSITEVDPEECGRLLPFLAFTSIVHGVRLELEPWYQLTLGEVLDHREVRSPFVVPIDEEYLARLGH